MTLSAAVVAVVNRERERQGLDRKAFAKRAGMPVTTTWNKLSGTSTVKIDDVPGLATGLGWSMQKLLREAQRLMEQSVAMDAELAGE